MQILIDDLPALDDRVTAGLKKLGPWKRHLNVRTLDIAHYDACVEGQLKRHDLDLFDLCGCDVREMVRCGFDVPYGQHAAYAALTAVWKRALRVAA
jgi:hypothetical protein